MANSNPNQARLRSRCFEIKRSACSHRALIVISIVIMSLCSSTKPIASSHIHHLPNTPTLHLKKSANTNTTTGATTAAHQLNQSYQQQGTNRTSTRTTSPEANDDNHRDFASLATRYLDESDPYLADLNRLLSMGLERVLKVLAEVDGGGRQPRKRYRRQLSELELIKELNDTTPAPVYRELEQAARETAPRVEESGTHLLAHPAEAAPNASSSQTSSTTQRQRVARAKKQTASTTSQPSYSSPSVTGENPVSAYAMATTPASSIDAPQSVEVQVTNDQQQSAGGLNEGSIMSDLADTLAISTTRQPSRLERHSSKKPASSNGDLPHYTQHKLSKVPGPEHNPMKEIRVGANHNDDSSSVLALDESSNQDQASVNGLAEAISAELANRQHEVGADDAALLDQLSKPNFLATNLPLKRDKRPVQSRDEQQFQQPPDYQQSFQSNHLRQSLFPTTADSMALAVAPPLAPYTFDQNMALLNTGNLRQPGGERAINSYSNPLAGLDYGSSPAAANASRASGFARPIVENNWSVPLPSNGKSNKNSRPKASAQVLEMTNDIGVSGNGGSMVGNNNNNDDLSMLFHNSKMQNKRAGLALAENLKNNLLLPYQQPFSSRFSFTGLSNKKTQQQQQLTNMGSNAAASAPYRQYLNPLVAGSVSDQTKSSQEVVYGDGGAHFAQSSMTQQGTNSANQNQVLGMLRVAPSQLNAAISGALQQQRAAYAPLVRRNSPLAFLSGGGPSSAGAIDYLPYSTPAAYLAAAAAATSRYSRQQQNPQHRIYQHRIGRHEPGASGANPNYDDGAGSAGAGQPAASVATSSTSDPMWSDTQNHEEDYQQSPQTIQITAVPNGLGLANPNFVNGFNNFNGLGAWGGWGGGPWGGRQVLLVNKQPQQVGTEWRSWLIPVAIILALPLILGALFIPVFLKSVMFLIQILQMLGLLMPPSQLASHLLSNTHGSQSG